MRWIQVNSAKQSLYFYRDQQLLAEYLISTSKVGLGEAYGSLQTPTGRHIVCGKLGAEMPMNTIFVRRQAQSTLYQPGMSAEHPERDWILTRIIWLAGSQPGHNCFGRVDSRSRGIYIHGAPDDAQMGQPGSNGCIRMRNSDIVELYSETLIGTPVVIA